ncbi:helix-turn-helix domain-containing protein [Streptomyces smyrnaeus]|uniref:helix-turn-helix domain-containing protein n=1 Tax=Streptomyces smyrnaeus TaxID=1387713 RepID=UPI0033CADC9A
MEHQETQVTRVIARRVKGLRARNGLTAKQLAEALTAEGVTWDRGTVTKLETNRRDNVTVVELLALSKVLNVAPVHLLVPLDDAQPLQVTPKNAIQADRVRAWVRGEQPLPGTDLRTFRTEVPLGELKPTKTVRFGGRHGSAELNEAFDEERGSDGDGR